MTNMIRDWMTPTQKLIWLYRKGGSGGSSGVEKTVKASLVHVEDALAKNAKMVKAYIEPVQSGSGDPSPDNVRPITGHTGVSVVRTGKNLLDPNSPYLEDTLIGTDGSQGSNSNFNTWRFSSPNTFTVSINVTETTNPGRVVVFNANGSVSTYEAFSGTVGRRAISKTLTSGQYALISIRKSATDYQLEVGTETTYAPYNGTTYSVNFPALGKNLLDMSDANIEVGKYIDNTGAEKTNASNFYNSVYFPVKASTAYMLSTSTSIKYCSFMEYDENKTFIKRTLYGNGSTAISTQSHTMGSTTAFVIIGSNPTGNTIDLSGIKAINWMFNEGSTAETYEPYTTTVYGGTLDLTTGVLTVDKAIVDMGSLTYNYDSTNDFFHVTPSGIGTPIASISEELCSIYKINSGISDSAMATAGTGIYLVLSNGKHKIKDTRYSSGSDLATALTGQKLIYPLATPLTYQLTPTQITMLLGENNLWNDANGDTEVTYLASS